MNDTATLDPHQLSVPALHGYLLAAVAPRPIALASTVDKQGNVNLSPFSFFNVFSANPPVMIFSPARRGKDNSTKHTYENVLEVPEVVINVVNYSIVEQVSLASSEYPRDVNEFLKAGLTEIASIKVKPPRVDESPVSFECKVEKVIPLGSEGGAGNLVIARVELIHIHSQYLNEEGKLDTTALDLVGRMGGSWYTRASGDALFQVPKPIQSSNLGVDQLPASIRNSKVLTGNNLGRLGNSDQLPDGKAIFEWQQNSEISPLLKHPDAIGQLHILAQKKLEKGNIQQAFLTLMVADQYGH
jgi:flavin reductase (DIM6/NTAB) family NADH-FMN oxidoreductase RutF